MSDISDRKVQRIQHRRRGRSVVDKLKSHPQKPPGLYQLANGSIPTNAGRGHSISQDAQYRSWRTEMEKNRNEGSSGSPREQARSRAGIRFMYICITSLPSLVYNLPYIVLSIAQKSTYSCPIKSKHSALNLRCQHGTVAFTASFLHAGLFL